MDYIKNQEEAIAIVKQMIADGQVLQDVAEKYFPELKESENEKIREEIIDFLELPHPQFVGKRDHKTWIAWLEKQGEQKPNPYSGTSFAYNGHTWGMCARDNGVEILLDGELKAFLSLEKSFIYPIHPQPELAPKSALEAAKEEKADNQNCVKPVDEVEAKFKVGDWVVVVTSEGEKVVQINSIEYFESGEPRYITSTGKWFDNGTEAHLWTIQDAKDGDVLCTYECGKPKIVFILKGAPEKPYVLGYHCFYNIMYPHFEFDSEKGCLAPNEEDLKPATKEQRDLLFQKMHEAGYEWDAEKKELKKIEQKPAWGEEDEKMLNSIIEDFGDGKTSNMLQEYFLKSLKDRVQPQPRQGWSEEDKRSIRDSIFYLKSAKKYFEKDDDILWDERWFNLCIEFLEALYKKLQPQPQWKPSDEQMDSIDCAVRKMKESACYNSELVSLFNDLKKLRGE